MRNQYFLLRHGQTVYQTFKKNKIYPAPKKDSKPPLTKEGERQIKKVAKELKDKGVDLIFASDTLRTKQTAKIVAKELKIPIFFDKRLRDVNLGIYHNRLKEEYFRAFASPIERFEKKPPKGESWIDCQKRVLDFIREIEKKYRGKKILIISHGDPLWLLEGYFKGFSKEELLLEKERNFIKTGELRFLKTLNENL